MIICCTLLAIDIKNLCYGRLVNRSTQGCALSGELIVDTLPGVSWKTKVKSVFGKLGKCCFYLQYFLYNIDNEKSKQKYTKSHSSY